MGTFTGCGEAAAACPRERGTMSPKPNAADVDRDEANEAELAIRLARMAVIEEYSRISELLAKMRDTRDA